MRVGRAILPSYRDAAGCEYHRLHRLGRFDRPARRSYIGALRVKERIALARSPAPFALAAVLLLNLVGDSLRDAADPYQRQC